MNKICTTIEESKKLIELGIDASTADMHYNDWVYDFYDGYEHTGNYVVKLGEPQTICGELDIPAWTLSALLELIPPYLGEFNEGIDFGLSKSMNGKWYSAHYIRLNDDGIVTFNKTVTGDTAIDAVFEMVVWLLESHFI